MRIFKILATITFILSLSSPSFSQSAAAGGASGGAGAAEPARQHLPVRQLCQLQWP